MSSQTENNELEKALDTDPAPSAVKRVRKPRKRAVETETATETKSPEKKNEAQAAVKKTRTRRTSSKKLPQSSEQLDLFADESTVKRTRTTRKTKTEKTAAEKTDAAKTKTPAKSRRTSSSTRAKTAKKTKAAQAKKSTEVVKTGQAIEAEEISAAVPESSAAVVAAPVSQPIAAAERERVDVGTTASTAVESEAVAEEPTTVPTHKSEDAGTSPLASKSGESVESAGAVRSAEQNPQPEPDPESETVEAAAAENLTERSATPEAQKMAVADRLQAEVVESEEKVSEPISENAVQESVLPEIPSVKSLETAKNEPFVGTASDTAQSIEEKPGAKRESGDDDSLLPQVCRSIWAKAAVVLIVAALCCTLPYWWYFKRTVTFPEGVPYVDVTVPSGASGRAIANRIAQAGIKVSPDTLARLLQVQSSSLAIHAGRYRFVPGMTLAEIVDKLQRSDLEKFSFRIPDGQTIWDLRKAVAALPDIDIKTVGMTDAELRVAVGVAEPHLEGVFAPETYSFRSGITDIDVYRAAYREQMRILNEEWEKRSPQAAVKTKYEALILASIIEKETSMKTDRALVSSVFNNRLRMRMPLQTDPTIIYGIGQSFNGNLTRRDMQRPGPYNTYLNMGLPPTPISMPTAASIHAALNPAKTKYLYFVARGDGTTHFSKSLAEHNRAVEKYQKAPARRARALQRRLNGQ